MGFYSSCRHELEPVLGLNLAWFDMACCWIFSISDMLLDLVTGMRAVIYMSLQGNLGSCLGTSGHRLVTVAGSGTWNHLQRVMTLRLAS